MANSQHSEGFNKTITDNLTFPQPFAKLPRIQFIMTKIPDT